jgi:hypothetical protein
MNSDSSTGFHGVLLDAERSIARNRARRHDDSHILSNGDPLQFFSCKQAIFEVLKSTMPKTSNKNIGYLAFAVYVQVRGKWRTVYNSQPRVYLNEPSGAPLGVVAPPPPVVGQPSKRMRALPREIAIPAAERLVTWAMDRITQLHAR